MDMQNGNRTPRREMKVSELSRAADIAPSAIHYYVQLGVLHRPKKVGLNLHLYDETHLARLRQIRHLQENNGLSLSQIKGILQDGRPHAESRPPRPGREEQANREKIVDMAIKLFSEKGYENTKVSDITEALRMGKGTFYVYFKNKRELFIECIDRLGVAIVPRESWDAIRQEKDYVSKNVKRGEAFLRAFPGYRGILNMVRGAIGGKDPVLARKATEAFRVLSRPLLKDLRRAIAQGAVHIEHDEAFIAYLQLVIAEAFGYWQMIDPRYNVEEGVQILMDIFAHGLLQVGSPQGEAVDSQGPVGELEDRAGVKTRLRSISVDGKPVLWGRMGDAEVDVNLRKLQGARFQVEAGRYLAKVATEEGEEFEIEVNEDADLSGVAAFGSMRIPLKRISSIRFGEG